MNTIASSPTLTRRNYDVHETKFLSFWITNRCNEHCIHCYAGSGPQGLESIISTEKWLELLTEAAKFGIETVQFIGGEPTEHPDLALFIHHATSLGLKTEVFSNMVNVTDGNWKTFTDCHVSLATSFYSAQSAVHDAITDSEGNHPKIIANIRRALSLGLPLRVQLVRVFEDQNVEEAMTFLRNLGVKRIGSDDVHGIGRGSALDSRRKNDALCGECGNGKACIDYLGRVLPCTFAQWITYGNVRQSSLTEILSGDKIVLERTKMSKAFADRQLLRVCDPYDCSPNFRPPCGPNKN